MGDERRGAAAADCGGNDLGRLGFRGIRSHRYLTDVVYQITLYAEPGVEDYLWTEMSIRLKIFGPWRVFDAKG